MSKLLEQLKNYREWLWIAGAGAVFFGLGMFMSPFDSYGLDWIQKLSISLIRLCVAAAITWHIIAPIFFPSIHDYVKRGGFADSWKALTETNKDQAFTEDAVSVGATLFVYLATFLTVSLVFCA